MGYRCLVRNTSSVAALDAHPRLQPATRHSTTYGISLSVSVTATQPYKQLAGIHPHPKAQIRPQHPRHSIPPPTRPLSQRRLCRCSFRRCSFSCSFRCSFRCSLSCAFLSPLQLQQQLLRSFPQLPGQPRVSPPRGAAAARQPAVRQVRPPLHGRVVQLGGGGGEHAGGRALSVVRRHTAARTG